MCEIDCKVPIAPKFEKVEIRNHCKRNVKKFLVYLDTCSDYSPLLESTDVEAITAGLCHHIEQAYATFFPCKTIERHEKFIHKDINLLLNF